MVLGGFLGHSWLKDHPWQAVPNLPCPLGSLWSNPGKVSADRDTSANAVELYLHYMVMYNYFLMNFWDFLGHSWLKDHPWQAVPDLPRPLASLWSYPGKVSAERDTTVNAVDDILVPTVDLVLRFSILKVNLNKISLLRASSNEKSLLNWSTSQIITYSKT